jgi:hypothetical protein
MSDLYLWTSTFQPKTLRKSFLVLSTPFTFAIKADFHRNAQIQSQQVQQSSSNFNPIVHQQLLLISHELDLAQPTFQLLYSPMWTVYRPLIDELRDQVFGIQIQYKFHDRVVIQEVNCVLQCLIIQPFLLFLLTLLLLCLLPSLGRRR